MKENGAVLVPLLWMVHDELHLVLVLFEFGSVKTTVEKISK